LVFSLPIGSESARGFSIWDDESPLVAVNTAYNPASRVFTLFHELGHLVTRTNSICVEDGSRRRMGDGSEDVERWCEGFSASLLMPRSALESLLAGEGKSVDLKVAGKVSRHFNVSLRAAVIRLIDLGRTNWGLYRSIPTSSDGKHGGGGGKGRNLAQRRLDEYGTRTPQLLMRAWKADLLDPVEVMQRLDVTWEGLEGLRRRVGS
jgi:Zn-dependent peptidase ImmA (M78 family)